MRVSNRQSRPDVNPGDRRRGLEERAHSTRFSGKICRVISHDEDQPRESAPAADPKPELAANAPRELGGRNGPEPTRFGDWELRGRCIDF